jgi:hypothetical protein
MEKRCRRGMGLRIKIGINERERERHNCALINETPQPPSPPYNG